MRARTSWRITCARSASGPRWWWGCASSARSRCSSRSSASSRPAAPTCRSTPTIRPSASPSCWTTPARRCCSRTRHCSIACPRHRARIVRLDADWPAIAAQPATAPVTSARSAEHRLCHLHLRLHGNPEGRRRRASRHSQSCGCPDRALRHRIRCPRSSVRIAELRRRDLGDCDGFDLGRRPRPADSGAQRRCVGTAHPRARCQPCDVAAGAAGRSACGPAARDPGRRRRGLFRGCGRRVGRRAGG